MWWPKYNKYFYLGMSSIIYSEVVTFYQINKVKKNNFYFSMLSFYAVFSKNYKNIAKRVASKYLHDTIPPYLQRESRVPVSPNSLMHKWVGTLSYGTEFRI